MSSVSNTIPAPVSRPKAKTPRDKQWAEEAYKSALDAGHSPLQNNTDPFMDHIKKMLDDRAPNNIDRQTKLVNHQLASAMYRGVYSSAISGNHSDKQTKKQAKRTAKDAEENLKQTWKDKYYPLQQPKSEGDLPIQKLAVNAHKQAFKDARRSGLSKDEANNKALEKANEVRNDKFRSFNIEPQAHFQLASPSSAERFFGACIRGPRKLEYEQRPAPVPRPSAGNADANAEALEANAEALEGNAGTPEDAASKQKGRPKNVYGRKTWFGWDPRNSAQPDQDVANYLSVRKNFKDATSTHSKKIIAVGILLTGVGGVLVAPLAFSTISDLCKADAHNPTSCRNSKFAAAGAALICVAGILTGISLCVSDQRKKRRTNAYGEFHNRANAA